MEWILTNKKNYLPSDGNFISYTGENYTLYISDGDFDINILNQDTVVLIDGYLLPRLNSNILFNKQNPSITIKDLYRRAGKDYINDVKGCFISMILKKNKFIIDSDHFGVKKFFIYENDNTFIISNNIKYIVREIKPDISRYAIIDHVLFNRYINGNTIYKGITFNRPSQRFIFNGILRRDYYWDYNTLHNSGNNNTTLSEHIYDYKNIVKGYIDHCKYNNISVPLTGGVDCRTIIAALLSFDIKPSSYTYSHPESNDSIYGEHAARALNLQFNVHYLYPDSNEYCTLAKEIWENGNTLVSLHRAHRLYGIKQEAGDKKPLMFLGYMGGDWVRGLWPDDLIISRALRRRWEDNKDVDSIVEDEFKRNYLKYTKNDIEYGHEVLNKFAHGGEFACFLRYLVQGVAHMHFSQDLNLFERYTIPVPIYMDIDYLYSLFSTEYTFQRTGNMTRNKLKKLRSPEYNSHLLYKLFPASARIPVGNGYTPSLYIRSRYLAFMQKVLYDKFISKKYKKNYTYDAWFNTFLINSFHNNEQIDDIFSISMDDILSTVIRTEPDAFPFSRYIDIGNYINTNM